MDTDGDGEISFDEFVNSSAPSLPCLCFISSLPPSRQLSTLTHQLYTFSHPALYLSTSALYLHYTSSLLLHTSSLEISFDEVVT